MIKNNFTCLVVVILLLVGFFRFSSAAQASLNLITNPGAETIDYRGWSLTNSFDSGWWITGGDYAHSGLYGFISSYNHDTMSQEIDLLARGYASGALDAAPTVSVSTFVTGHWPNPSDAYRVIVELRDEDHNIIDSFDSGIHAAAGDHVWTEVSHTFAGYGPGLRYIYLRQEGDDAEFWDGAYGTVFDDASVTIGGAGPSLAIIAPGNGQTVATWSPNINWGNSASCWYSYDGITYLAANCASHGADIAQTQTTLNPMLYIAGIDSDGNSSVVSSTFIQGPSNPYTFGLVGHWKFDEASAGGCAGGKDACDSSPSGNHGTYSGPPTASIEKPDAHFPNQGSLSFNGNSDYVTVTRPVADDFSICAWIKTATPGNTTNHWETAPIFDAEVPGVASDFGFGIDSEGYLAYGNGGMYDATVNGATSVIDNEWHHVCVTRQEATREVELFVDGTSDATGSTHSAVLNSSATARIGYGLDGVAARHFDGLIDDVRVYERVLPSSIIRDLSQGFTTTDHTVPVITRNGSASVDTYAGSAYIDAGATAFDNIDGNITGSIAANSSVNTAVPGTYGVTYSVTDASGNAATPVTRTVRVVPTSNSGLSLLAYAGPAVPAGGFKLAGSATAGNSNIAITANAGSDVVSAAFSTSPQFIDAALIPYQSLMQWNLCGSVACAGGSYTVYAKFYTAWGRPSPVQTFSVMMPASGVTLAPSAAVKAPVKKTAVKRVLTKTLVLGASNEEVRILQSILAKLPGIYPEGRITGSFGPLTLKAVQRFQVAYALAGKGSVGFGVVGPRTRAKLAEVMAK